MGGGHIRQLAELGRADEALFGGKSASLGELIAGEIAVPPGFAVAATAFREFLERAALDRRIAGELTGVELEDVEALRRASGAIAGAVRAAPLPGALRDQIADRYRALAATAGEPEPPVAVRSSALGEDSADASFAGQQETYLWVRGAEPVCAAVHDCWASLYSPEAISYRARQAIAGEPPAMAVAVQLMVDAAVAGVAFTCNPVSGDPSTVAVNAAWGLGLAVAGGEVTPDYYLVSKVTGEALAETIGSKQVEYLPAPGGAGTVRAEVPDERREIACLERAELEALVEIARRTERHFGCHQDIEWAIDRERSLPASLFVLQSRPVTGTPSTAGPAAPRSAIDLVMGTFGASGGGERS